MSWLQVCNFMISPPQTVNSEGSQGPCVCYRAHAQRSTCYLLLAGNYVTWRNKIKQQCKKIMPSSPNAREYLLSAPILKHIVGNLDIILQSTVMFQYFNILHIRRLSKKILCAFLWLFSVVNVAVM